MKCDRVRVEKQDAVKVQHDSSDMNGSREGKGKLDQFRLEVVVRESQRRSLPRRLVSHSCDNVNRPQCTANATVSLTASSLSPCCIDVTINPFQSSVLTTSLPSMSLNILCTSSWQMRARGA